MEVRLPVEKYSPQSKELRYVEPAFEVKGVPYYDVLPVEPTERRRHTLLPMSLIGDWVQNFVEDWNLKNEKKKSIGWKGDASGIRNPNFGSAEHYAEVEYDENGNLVNFISDGILWQNGKLDTMTGIATPGSVIAPIEKRDEGYYVHCFWQWRPAPWDAKTVVPAELTDPKDIESFKALNTGMWLLTTPGGFAQLVADTPETVAKREAIEEAGLKIGKPVFRSKSFNRANVATLVGIGYSTFERIGDEIKRSARFLRDIKLSKNKMTEIMGMYTKMEKYYLQIMNSFYKRNKELLLESGVNRDEIMKSLENFLNKNYAVKYVPNIVEKLKSIGNFGHSIVKTMIYN